MHITDFTHVLNPNSEKSAAVFHFFNERSALRSVSIEKTSHPTHLETVVEWAINEGRKNIAVWGGDGTFNRVVQKLYEMNALGKVTLALIPPAGTCNDFARTLKIPAWKKYVSTALRKSSTEQMVDIGLLSYISTQGLRKRIFINNAGFGRKASALERHRSSPIADILSFRPKRIDIDWTLKQTQSFETKEVLLGMVCNGAYFSKGLHFESDISINDSTLEAYFEGPQSKLRLLLLFLKAWLGGTLKNSKTTHFSAQELTVQSSELLALQADGEAIDKDGATRISFSVLPKAVRISHWA